MPRDPRLGEPGVPADRDLGSTPRQRLRGNTTRIVEEAARDANPLWLPRGEAVGGDVRGAAAAERLSVCSD